MNTTIEVKINEFSSDATVDHIRTELLKCGVESTVEKTGFFKRTLLLQVDEEMDKSTLVSLGILIGTLEGARINK